MRDIWAFLLQTLTAAGVAALMLALKYMFRDKLSPRWQFAAWAVLGLVLLLPAGMGGRYVLFRWSWLVETWKALAAGDYTFTRVTAPFPLPPGHAPETFWDWLFLAYLAGVLLLLGRYLLSYLRLRRALKRGGRPSDRQDRVETVAARYGLKSCPAVEVEGLPSAFLCGVVSPVLALPAGAEVDDKVLLHELLHLKHHDTLWGVVLCLVRCVHWCDPLLWYCADRAGNDLEALCDQRVLELLEGEERRDYGHILLSMANERYPRSPGTSSLANGGENIRRRIEAIAHFKRYPAGMALVSVCILLTLAVPLTVGAEAGAEEVRHSALRSKDAFDIQSSMASARTLYCSTPAGALDTYAKAVLTGRQTYRAMCAPEADQAELVRQSLRANPRGSASLFRLWDEDLPIFPSERDGYRIYNLMERDGGYEGLLAVQFSFPPDGSDDQHNITWLWCQNIRAQKEKDRWVVAPLGGSRTVKLERWSGFPSYGCEDLPAFLYQGEAEGFLLTIRCQSTFYVDSYQTQGDWFSSYSTFDTTPQLNAPLGSLHQGHQIWASYTGDPDAIRDLDRIAVSWAPITGDKRPDLRDPYRQEGISSASGDGSALCIQDWRPECLENGVSFGGSGFDVQGFSTCPEAYAVDFYLDEERVAQLTLPLKEGGPQ